MTGSAPLVPRPPQPSPPAAGNDRGGGADPATAEQPLSERVHRPWGWFETVAAAAALTAEPADTRSGYLVKRLWIHPHGRISLQRHHQRCEHWVVVAGSGELLCGDRRVDAQPGSWLEVPVGAVHRASAGAEGLLIIEVQRGEILREDDIERFADDYGRVIGSSHNL